jgi:hypothetical protein
LTNPNQKIPSPVGAACSPDSASEFFKF